MGALQPPSSLFKNSRSIFVEIAVSSWFSGAQASMASTFELRDAIITAPCAGAGTIHSKFTESSGVNSRRPNPAAAKMAPFQSLFSNLSNRVFTFPLMPTILCVG